MPRLKYIPGQVRQGEDAQCAQQDHTEKHTRGQSDIWRSEFRQQTVHGRGLRGSGIYTWRCRIGNWRGSHGPKLGRRRRSRREVARAGSRRHGGDERLLTAAKLRG